MPELRFVEALRVLRAAQVDFILVGGLSAVLNGAPVSTFDVDVVHARDTANIERLLAALTDLDAVFRMQPERRLRPGPTHLTSVGHVNLLTRFGPLDLLGTIGRGLGYSDLFPHSHMMEIGGGTSVRVLDLETLIALKEQLNGEKDRAVLPVLRRTLSETLRVSEKQRDAKRL